MQEILTRQAAGLGQVVTAAGGDANDALRLLIADKLEELVKIQVEAIKNVKIDKITVWDSQGGDGQAPATANFLSGLMKSIPPLQDLFNMAGMNLPSYLGQPGQSAAPALSGQPEGSTPVSAAPAKK